MPDPLLLLPPLPPPHTMRYSAGMAPHRGPAWLVYCQDTRPGQLGPNVGHLETAQRQHADLCKSTSVKAAILQTILLGVGGTCYTERNLNQLNNWDLTTNVPFNLLANFMFRPGLPIAMRQRTKFTRAAAWADTESGQASPG
eukprot:773074-Pelagomonas_calceolata.AAC.1